VRGKCEEGFNQLKCFLASPPILHKPKKNNPILVHLVITQETINVMLVQEQECKQHLIYFTSWVPQDAKTQYQVVEKMALWLVSTGRRLRPYSQRH